MPTIILGGTTGVNIDPIRSFLENQLGLKTFKFEEYLKEEWRSPAPFLFQFMSLGRESMINILKRSTERVITDLKEVEKAGKNSALALHFVYYRKGHLIINPVLEEIIRKTNVKAILLFMEDYYHALYRILSRIKRRKPIFQQIDPLTYLYWRATEIGLILSLVYKGISTYLLANKHDKRIVKRLVEHVLGIHRYKLVYVGHHITSIREKAIKEHSPLNDMDIVKEIQNFKDRLLTQVENLIVFDPTTIDELIYDEEEKIKTCIEEEDRWPFSSETIHHDYHFPIDLIEEFKHLYPTELMRSDNYLRLVKEAIERQIEARDFLYINQSDVLVVYRPKLWGIDSRGVTYEVSTAQAQAKPVYCYTIEEEVISEREGLFNYTFWLTDFDALQNLLQG